MKNSRPGKGLLIAGISLLAVAVLLFIFTETWATPICFGLSILFNVAGLTVMTMPENRRKGARRG